MLKLCTPPPPPPLRLICSYTTDRSHHTALQKPKCVPTLVKAVTHFVQTVFFLDVADCGLATEVIRFLLGTQVKLLGLGQDEERGLHACGKSDPYVSRKQCNLPLPTSTPTLSLGSNLLSCQRWTRLPDAYRHCQTCTGMK